MPFKLTILGSSSAIPTINNKPTAQLLNVNERFFLIDCGEGTQVRLREYKINPQRISHIFISHLHGDHYFGLIGLLTSMHLLGRKRELHVYAHQKLEDIIYIQLDASNTELNYPLFFHPVSEEDECVLLDNDHVIVNNILLDHSLSCSGFLFKEKKSKRKINQDAIVELKVPFDKINGIKEGADWINRSGEVVKNNEITFPNTLPHSYAFCTDTRYNKDIIDKIRGVNLLYYETTFKKDLIDRAKKTGHSTTSQAAQMACRADVKNLIIGHFSQRYKNLNELLLEVQEDFKNSIIAKPGLTIDFKLLDV